MQLDLLTAQTGNLLISVYNDQWKLMWYCLLKIISFIILQCLALYKICAWIFPLLIPLEEKQMK